MIRAIASAVWVIAAVAAFITLIAMNLVPSVSSLRCGLAGTCFEISHHINPSTGLYDRRWWFKRLPYGAELAIVRFEERNNDSVAGLNLEVG